MSLAYRIAVTSVVIASGAFLCGCGCSSQSVESDSVDVASSAEVSATDPHPTRVGGAEDTVSDLSSGDAPTNAVSLTSVEGVTSAVPSAENDDVLILDDVLVKCTCDGSYFDITIEGLVYNGTDGFATVDNVPGIAVCGTPCVASIGTDEIAVNNVDYVTYVVRVPVADTVDVSVNGISATSKVDFVDATCDLDMLRSDARDAVIAQPAVEFVKADATTVKALCDRVATMAAYARNHFSNDRDSVVENEEYSNSDGVYTVSGDVVNVSGRDLIGHVTVRVYNGDGMQIDSNIMTWDSFPSGEIRHFVLKFDNSDGRIKSHNCYTVTYFGD